VGGPGTTLAAKLAAGGFGLLDQDAPNLIEAYARVVVPPPAPPHPPTVEFVTITPAAKFSSQNQQLTLWFHPNVLAADGSFQIVEPVATVLEETAAGVTTLGPLIATPAGQPNLFRTTLKPPSRSPLLRFAFDTRKTQVRKGAGQPEPLQKYINDNNLDFVGYHAATSIILVFVQTSLAVG
jgi:hypothetical protein